MNFTKSTCKQHMTLSHGNKLQHKLRVGLPRMNWFSCNLFCNDTWRSLHQQQHATDDNIIRRMCIARWIIKATSTPIIYNIYWFSTATMITRTLTRPTVTFIRALPVLFRLNIEVFSVAKERQQWVPFALLSSYKIFPIAINMMRINYDWVCLYSLLS